MGKAARIFPRPLSGALRPVVHAPTNKYNMKERYGRGFTFEELKEAGIDRRTAQTIGIAVDHRRRNRSEKVLQANAQRLKLYKSKLVVFPRNQKKPKKGDATKEEMEKPNQVVGPVLPIKRTVTKSATQPITEEMKKKSVVRELRMERANQRLVGYRKKKAAAKAAQAEL